MSVYKFHFGTSSGSSPVEAELADLADLDAAKTEATQTLGRMLCDAGADLWGTRNMAIWVTDERGRALFSLLVDVCEPPAMRAASVPNYGAARA